MGRVVIASILASLDTRADAIRTQRLELAFTLRAGSARHTTPRRREPTMSQPTAQALRTEIADLNDCIADAKDLEEVSQVRALTTRRNKLAAQLRAITAPVAAPAASDDGLDFSLDAMRAPASTYRRREDVSREMSREARETGIAFTTLAAGSR